MEYDHVNYVTRSFWFYGSGGGVVVAPLVLEGFADVATDFNVTELRAAILDSQQNGQEFPQFCIRATRAGVQSTLFFCAVSAFCLQGAKVTRMSNGFRGEARGRITIRCRRDDPGGPRPEPER